MRPQGLRARGQQTRARQVAGNLIRTTHRNQTATSDREVTGVQRMDFLNKAMGQLADLFKSMTPGSRITAGMLLVVIAVSLTYLFVFQFNTANEYLFGSREFSQAELDAMQSAFAAAQPGRIPRRGPTDPGPAPKLVEYLQALSQGNFLPQNFDSAIDEAIANSNSIIDSKPLQDLQVRPGQTEEALAVISAFTGVDTATVQFQEVKKEGFPPQVERKATVAARATGGGKLAPGLVQAIRTAASGWFGVTAGRRDHHRLERQRHLRRRPGHARTQRSAHTLCRGQTLVRRLLEGQNPRLPGRVSRASSWV